MADTYTFPVCVICKTEIDESNEHKHQGEGHDVQRIQLVPVTTVNVLATGLRRICTAGSLLPGDPLDDAYRKAGGGYGGLQEIAVKTLEIAEIER